MRLIAGAALAFALVAAGCVHGHAHYREAYLHRHAGPTIHAHGDGCGHYFWHGEWHAVAHPLDCGVCFAPRAIVTTHYHGPGCGHWFWHGAWYATPHPLDCATCGGPSRIVVSHVHAAGCGHYYYHGTWWGKPHPFGCCVAPRAGVSISVGGPGVGLWIGGRVPVYDHPHHAWHCGGRYGR